MVCTLKAFFTGHKTSPERWSFKIKQIIVVAKRKKHTHIYNRCDAATNHNTAYIASQNVGSLVNLPCGISGSVSPWNKTAHCCPWLSSLITFLDSFPKWERQQLRNMIQWKPQQGWRVLSDCVVNGTTIWCIFCKNGSWATLLGLWHTFSCPVIIHTYTGQKNCCPCPLQDVVKVKVCCVVPTVM